MKKKLLCLYALILMCIMGTTSALAADETVFDLSTATSSDYTLGGTTTVTTVKINTNTNSVSAVKFANGWSSNYFKIAPEGGFKSGDVIKIAGCYHNTSTKTTALAIYTSTTSDAIYTTANVINARLVADNPAEETYTLTADATELYFARTGATATYITTLLITRAAATAPTFTTDLSSTANVAVGNTTTFSIVASGADSYQWYTCDDAEKTNAAAIDGATSASYDYTATEAGTAYIYCVATNTIGSTTSTVCAVTAEVSTDLTVTYATANICEDGSGTANPSTAVLLATLDLNGSNVEWGSDISYNSITYSGITATGTTTTSDNVSFTIYPKQGVTFTPSNVSFGIIRSGTNGGTMTVKVNGTTISSGKVPGRNSSGKEQDGYSFNFNLSDITATKASPLTVSISVVGLTSSRSWGLADLVVSGSYIGTPEDGTMYSVATTVSPAEAGTISQSPSGTSLEEALKVKFTATPNEGYYFVNWTEGGEEIGTSTTYTISSLSDDVDITANFAAYTAVSFNNNDAEAYGVAPETQYGIGSVAVTMPTNTTLYKKGYTLTGWNDGETTYAVGASKTFTANTVLTPVFTANTVSQSDLTAETTYTWKFGTKNSAPEYTGGVATANVKQVTISGSTIDLGIKMSAGKNSDRSDEWLNTQNGDFVIPVSYGAVITANTYYSDRAATFNGEEVTGSGSTGAFVFSYTYEGSENEITVNFGSQFLDYIKVTYTPTVAMTITEAEWASFSSTSEVAIPAGVTAYYASASDGSSVTLTEIEGGYIPANTGVVVNGSEGTFYAAVTSTDATVGGTNLLQAWTTAGTPTAETYYTLAAGPTFKQSTGGTLAAGKAYLVIPAGARVLTVDFGETTGIEDVRGKMEDVRGEYFDLQGRKVAQPAKGLYIQNGKKVIINK